MLSSVLLKQYNRRWFLICHRHHQDTAYPYLVLSLDRIEGSIMADSKAHYEKPDYDYIQESISMTIGVSHLFNDKNRPRNIKLKVSSSQYNYLRTKPIHPDQEWTGPDDDGNYLLKVKLRINYELIHLLLSYGDGLEVKSPTILRKVIAEETQSILTLYKDITK